MELLPLTILPTVNHSKLEEQVRTIHSEEASRCLEFSIIIRTHLHKDSNSLIHLQTVNNLLQRVRSEGSQTQVLMEGIAALGRIVFSLYSLYLLLQISSRSLMYLCLIVRPFLQNLFPSSHL